MAQGLLEASGYSDTPVTFGQAIGMGLKRSNESQAAADASVAAQQKAYMDNLLVQSQNYKNYQSYNMENHGHFLLHQYPFVSIQLFYIKVFVILHLYYHFLK